MIKLKNRKLYASTDADADGKTSAEIMELFKSLNEQGRTVIIVTHDPKVAEQCGRVIEISDGRVVY